MDNERDEGWVVVRGDARGFATDITAGEHALRSDEPASMGGTETGPTPYDLVLAGLGACTSMTLGMYARRKGWPLEWVEVRLRHSKIHADDCAHCETEEGMLDRIECEIVVAGAIDDEQRQKLLWIAGRCPVHRTLTSEIAIESKIVSAE